MMRSAFFGSFAALGWGQDSNVSDCRCPWTSSNRNSCCSTRNEGGEGTGDFCGNLFQKNHCGGDTPVCCNSDITSSCGPVGSSCAPGCILGYKGLGSECQVIPPPAPSPASQAWNVGGARAMAYLAAGAGCGPTDEFKNFHCKACRDVGFDVVPGTIRYVTHDDLGQKNATFAFIARLRAYPESRDSDYGCIISIRGSKNLVNSIQDAEFWKQTPDSVEGCDGCKVHTGFYHAWKDLEDDAVAALADIGCTPESDNKVLVTGHSLGAAASIMAMFRLKGMGFDVQQSVVFEPPRLGNKAFANAFATRFKEDGIDIPVFMHTHAMDPVVHLPPTGLPGIEYQHVVAPEVYYFPSNDINEYIVCDGPDDPLCSTRYALLDTITSGDDHCKNWPLAPEVGSDGIRDFCNPTAEFCSGGTSGLVV